MKLFQRKAILFVMLLSVSLLISCSSEAQKPNEGTTINTENSTSKASAIQNVGLEQFEILVNGDGTNILDVRTPGEVAQGYVEGAVNVNINDADFAEKVKQKLNPEIPVAVYCKMGGRSARAANTLESIGFQTIYNYTGGMNEWSREGKPTVK